MVRLAINGRFLAQSTTGVQRVAREITREIDGIVSEGGSDLDVTLVCQPEASVDALNLRSIKVKRIGGLTGQGWEQTSLPLAAKDSILLCLGNSAPVFSLVTRAPVTVMIHDLSYRYHPNAYRTAYRMGHAVLMPLMLKLANPVITVSETERARLSELGSDTLARKIVVAQNGGWRDGPDAPRGDQPTPEPGYLLYVGALTHRKNLAGLLESAARLAREDGLRLVVVGSTTHIHTHVPLMLADDVRDNVTFLGQVENTATLADIYRGACCLVFPSFYEASPLPPLEAMHFGCPVVVSDIPSLRERCGDAAEYCDPFDVDSIVGAVRRVVHDKKRQAQLVRLGNARAALFSWRAQAESVVAAIKSLALARKGVDVGVRTRSQPLDAQSVDAAPASRVRRA